MNVALIFAGGVGSRMGTKTAPKQFLSIDGHTILAHTINAFEKNPQINAIVIVLLEQYIELATQIFSREGFSKIKSIIPGGKTGQESIYFGLKEIERLYGTQNPIVLIHDGVRPIFESDLIERNILSVKKYGTAISSVPAKETIVTSTGQDITKVLDRNSLWIARAPQSFYLNDIISAHQNAIANQDNSVIDSCTMIKKYGSHIPLRIVETIYDNIKVTTPMDYFLIKSIAEAKKHNYDINDFIDPILLEGGI